MSDMMFFPVSWEDFLREYSFKDKEEIYTNGADLIPVFRVRQMMEHYHRDWISVKDRLPEKGTYDRHFVHVENTTNFNRLLDNDIIALWCDDDWLYDGWEDNRVTHWMPLPQSLKARMQNE